MPRKLNRLTAVAVKNAKPSEGGKSPKLYSDGGGLYLQVTPSGVKSWMFRYSTGGKPCAIGLGALWTLPLEEAREEATRLRKLIKQGADPKVERARAAAGQKLAQDRTFRICAAEFIETHKQRWTNPKHLDQWRNSLAQYAYPVIGDLPVAEIDVHLVQRVLTKDKAWLKKNETMSRVRGRIERILGWATVLGYRVGENPARWTNFLSEVLPARDRKTAHFPAIPYADIPDFIKVLRDFPKSGSAKLALEFLILTAARTGEVIGAKWSEIDFESKIWTVPAERMKSKREHRVPLCDRAVEILTSSKKTSDGEYVFRGRKYRAPISNMAMLQLMRRLGKEEVPHGMRSSFRDWAAEQSGYPKELAEASLAHVLENKTEAAYQRADLLEQRRLLIHDWELFCLSKLKTQDVTSANAPT